MSGADEQSCVDTCQKFLKQSHQTTLQRTKLCFLFIYRFTVWQKIFPALYFLTGVGGEIEEADCPSVLKQKGAQPWAKTSLHINKVKRKTLLVEIQDSVFFLH